MNYLNNILHGDCLDLMKYIPDNSVDMILCDPPFGITSRNKWDKVIQMDKMWEEYRRITKPNSAIVLFAQGIFSARLILSAEDIFRYDFVWRKNKTRGHLNANKQPLRNHENILVFYKNQPTYNPQKSKGHKPVNSYTKNSDDPDGSNYGKTKSVSGGGSTERFPVSVLDFNVVNNEDPDKFHSTQKPVPLGIYLIKTFTNVGDTVLDNACGSGTFPLAAMLLNRNYIGMDISEEFVNKAKDRLNKYLHKDIFIENNGY